MYKYMLYICFVFALLGSISCQEENPEPEVVGLFVSDPLAWDYPIKPGTPEWARLSSNAEKVAVCQIPEEVIASLTTKQLLDVSLAYPLLPDVYAFENIENGINKLFDDFNGLRALSQRGDAITHFVEAYDKRIKHVPALDGNYPDHDKGEFIVGISNLELIATRAAFYIESARSNFSFTESKELMRALYEGYVVKYNNPTHFSGIGFQTNLFARMVLISYMHDIAIPGEVKRLEFDEETINWIDELSRQVIDSTR